MIATKVRGRVRSGINGMGLTRVHIHREVDASLRRLGLDHIDLYQKFMAPDPLTPIDETLWALDLVRGECATLAFPIRQRGALPKPMRLPEPIAWSRFESVPSKPITLAGRDLEREVLPMCREESLWGNGLESSRWRFAQW